MGWFQEIFPSWKDKLTLVFCCIALVALVALCSVMPDNPNDQPLSDSNSNDTVVKYQDDHNVCYVLVGKQSKDVHGISCVPKKED